MRLLLLLALAAPAMAEDVPEGAVHRYACAGGAALAVAYINPPGGADPTPWSCTTARSSR